MGRTSYALGCQNSGCTLNDAETVESVAGANEVRGIGQAARPISTGKLNVLPRLHLRPINLVVSKGSSGACARETSSQGGLRAYMHSALILSGHSYPALPLAGQPVH